MNIINLLESDGFTLKKMASTSGGEYSGACPFCGGVDRFRVWPEHNGGRYWCRGCDRKGDTIQYLREYRNLSFKAACQLLNKAPRPLAVPPAAAAQSRKELTAVIDSARWSEQAANFQETFVDCLWSEQGESARAFLSGRGLNDSTIKSAGIGYNIIDRFPSRSDFGLLEELNENGNQKKVWIPSGIVVPKIIDGQILRLRVRRMETDIDPKYVLITGSDTAPLVFPDRAHAQACIVVESELDAILINQEAGDLVTTVAMGSAQLKPDQKTEQILNSAETILVSLDADEAGAKAADKYWLPTYPNAKRWPVAIGKDASDAYQQGLDIRCWIEAGLTHEDGKHERRYSEKNIRND